MELSNRVNGFLIYNLELECILIRNYKMFKRISVTSYIIFVAFAIGGCKNPTDLSTEPTWQEVESPITTECLNSVFFTDENNGWIVGSGGTIIHWDGYKWKEWHESVVTKTFASVHGSDKNNVWAVGHDCTIIHFDGIKWSEFSAPWSHYTTDFLSIYCVSAEESWIVGDSCGHPLILHYNGTAWEKWEVITSYIGALMDVCFTSPSDGWAVGWIWPDTALILHYNGSTWEISDSLDLVGSIDERLVDVDFTSPSDGWALAFHNFLLHYNGSTWDTISTHILGCQCMDFLSPDNGWLIGTESIFHYDKGEFKETKLGITLSSIYFLSPNEGWAVGGPKIYHYY